MADTGILASMMGRQLVIGGARSGKSAHAESLLAGAEAVDFVAPGNLPGDDDPEWAERVRRHRERRPAGWRTLETLDIASVLRADATRPVLVDCLSTWLARLMDDVGTWDGRGDAELALGCDELVDAWASTARTAIAVTNEVGFGVVPATASGRRYRDELGRLNQRIAAASDEVWLLVAGIATRLKRS